MPNTKNKLLPAILSTKNFIIHGKISILDAIFTPNSPEQIKFVNNGKITIPHESEIYEFQLQNIGGKYFIAERNDSEYQKLRNYILLNENLVVNEKSTTKFKI